MGAASGSLGLVERKRSCSPAFFTLTLRTTSRRRRSTTRRRATHCLRALLSLCRVEGSAWLRESGGWRREAVREVAGLVRPRLDESKTHLPELFCSSLQRGNNKVTSNPLARWLRDATLPFILRHIAKDELLAWVGRYRVDWDARVG